MIWSHQHHFKVSSLVEVPMPCFSGWARPVNKINQGTPPAMIA